MTALVAPIPLAPLERFPPVGLAEVTAGADLQTRVDRKYLLPPAAAAQLLEQLTGRASVLDVGGLRAFGYESVYFDTAEHTSYLAAAHGRRRRFKVRTRTYLDSAQCVLEVKTAGGRGETVKERVEHPLADRDRLTADARAFVAERVGAQVDPAALAPAMTTTYDRSTLLGADLAFRMTLDVGLRCTSPTGGAATAGDHVLVETKTPGSAALPDRLLWAAGHRPVRVSKFCAGVAVTHPHLPSNRWHRTLQRCFTAA